MSTDSPKTELAAPKPTAIATGQRGLVLSNLDEMWRAASAFQKSGMFLKTHDTTEKVFVAMQCGAEVGLAPVQALMSIAVIQGRPTIWGDAIPGLVWASGLCEGITETIDGEGDLRTARCVAKRVGCGEIVGEFSMGDAKRAGLLGKGPWSQYPDRMLKTRARAFCLRDGFADVLKGLQCREEVLDYSTDIEVTASTPKLTAKLSQSLPEDEPQTVPAESE